MTEISLEELYMLLGVRDAEIYQLTQRIRQLERQADALRKQLHEQTNG